MGINNVIIKFGNSPDNELVLYLRVNDKKGKNIFALEIRFCCAEKKHV